MLENLQNAIRQYTAQTDLSEEVIVEAIEEALYAAARRVYGADANVSFEINLERSDIRCYVPKKVVNIMRDYSTEIPIEQAEQLQEGIEVGETLDVQIPPSEFGRIQAQLGRLRSSRVMFNVLNVVVSSWTLNRRKHFYRLVSCRVRKTMSVVNVCNV